MNSGVAKSHYLTYFAQMNYISTRGGAPSASFSSVVLDGMAPDGGLYLPGEIPDVTGRLPLWRSLGYRELAAEVVGLFADLPQAEVRELVDRSYDAFADDEVVRIVPVGGMHILELFHGPTLSFKDVALQFLGNLFDTLLERSGGELNILAATSGDTGSAAIHAVRGKKRLRIFVMHPKGRISPSQELQMTSVLDENVFNLAIDGTFDDCQGIMKSLFSDVEFKTRYSLGAVNSVNWARILAQVVYYFYAAFRVMERTGAGRVRVSVPTGNFGDIFAGYLACRMGLPSDMLVLATNENDILARFFESGTYSAGKVRETVSPSMDIQVASNFERYLFYRLGCDGKRVETLMKEFASNGRFTLQPANAEFGRGLIVAGSGDTASTLLTIRETYERAGYLLDPHTAVGAHVAARYMAPEAPMIVLATAHPAKFGATITDAIGKNIAHHPVIDRLTGQPTRCRLLPAKISDVRSFLMATLDRKI
ncbi:MAG: threonine synthase [bacterium]